MNPLVSVVLPVHNDAVRLERAVESIRAQTFADWDLWIVDDGSTDDTPAVARSLAQRDSRVRVLHQEKAGEARARNWGMKEATGTWIAVQDSDDSWHPERLERQLAFVETHPSVGVVASYGYRVSAAGTVLGVYDLGPTSLEEFRRIRGTDEPLALIHASVLMRRDIVGRSRGYPEDYPLSTDLAFFNLRMAPLTDIMVLRDRLVSLEIRPDSISRRFVDHATDDREVIRLNLRRALEGLPELDYRQSMEALAGQPLWWRASRKQQKLRQRWYTRGAARIAAGSPTGLGLLFLAFLLAPFYTVRRLWSQVGVGVLERLRKEKSRR